MRSSSPQGPLSSLTRALPSGLPGAITMGMEGAAALIAFFTFTFMMKENKIPQVVLLILGITFIWGIVSVFEGQSPAALAWGWWRFFKYPLAGLFAYLVIDSPKDFAKWFFKFCLALLAFQVGVQLVMYAMGYPISDELAGTFGTREWPVRGRPRRRRWPAPGLQAKSASLSWRLLSGGQVRAESGSRLPQQT